MFRPGSAIAPPKAAFFFAISSKGAGFAGPAGLETGPTCALFCCSSGAALQDSEPTGNWERELGTHVMLRLKVSESREGEE